MKATKRILLSASLATVEVGQSYEVPWARTWNFTYLQGNEALAYLFNYDPSLPQLEDTPYRRTWNENDELPAPEVYRPRYDVHYVYRLCMPSYATGEAFENLLALPLCKDGMSRDECREYSKTWESSLARARVHRANSPYPCERMSWIEEECGVGRLILDASGGTTSTIGKGTLKDQHECLCKGDYFAAQRACLRCQDIHIGNATLAELSKRVIDLESSSLCEEAATATKGLKAYEQSAWDSVYSGHDYTMGHNYTIVSDRAQNKTDVSFYMTESVDFLPATIQEPAFTRTVDGKAVVMTPGPLKGNAKAEVGSAPAVTEPSATSTAVTGTNTNNAAAAATQEAGAATMSLPGRLVAATIGALFVL